MAVKWICIALCVLFFGITSEIVVKAWKDVELKKIDSCICEEVSNEQ